MNCHKHPDRTGILTISQPSINGDVYMCLECRTAYVLTISQFKGKREAWETDLNMERDSQRARYGTSDWDDNINHDIAHRRAR